MTTTYFYNDAEADAVATTFFQNYYEDRGKIKWSGFFLSEHTAALKKHKEHIDGSQSAPISSQSKLNKHVDIKY